MLLRDRTRRPEFLVVLRVSEPGREVKPMFCQQPTILACRQLKRFLGQAVLVGSVWFSESAHAQFGPPGVVAFQPTIGSVLDGAALGVTPVVSADRRYVRLSMTPYFNAVEGFNTVVVPGAVSGGGGFGAGGGFGGGGVMGGGFGGGGGFRVMGAGALGPQRDPQASPPIRDSLAQAYVRATEPRSSPVPALAQPESEVQPAVHSQVPSTGRRTRRGRGVRPVATSEAQRTVRQP